MMTDDKTTLPEVSCVVAGVSRIPKVYATSLLYKMYDIYARCTEDRYDSDSVVYYYLMGYYLFECNALYIKHSKITENKLRQLFSNDNLQDVLCS